MPNFYTLDNGIRIVTERLDNYKSAAFGLWVEAGSVNETKENNGIAHVIEHMLFKGTKSRTGRMLADEITEIGGNLDAYTTREYTCFNAHTIDRHLPHAIELISDMICNSLFNEDELNKELGVILEEIDMYEDDPEELTGDLINQEVWKDQSLGFLISGHKDIVAAFKREDILAFMKSYYVGQRMVISLAGHFDEAAMIDLIKERFGSIPKGCEAQSDLSPVYHESFVLKQKPFEQVHLNLAFNCIPYNHQLQYIYYIVDNIVGSNQNSRLFQYVREDKGLTYSIYSYSSSFKKCGLFQIYAAANPSQLFSVLSAIKETLHQLITHPVDERELSLIKTQIETELTIAAESTQSRMDSNGDAVLYDVEIHSLDQILKDIDKITVEDVNQFIQTYITDATPSICVIGDLEKVDTAYIKEFQNKWQEA